MKNSPPAGIRAHPWRWSPLTALLFVAAATPGCSHEAPAATVLADAAPAATAPRESLGNVMVQVARRFEIAGKAASAGRFPLAEFEAGEIEELFEDDVPGAELPKEGPTVHIPAMARAFLETEAPALKKAAAAGDRAKFAAAFAGAATACNACHRASDKAFIEVPTVPGRGVPELESAAGDGGR